MAKKPGGLGRGLSNLLPGAEDNRRSIQISANPDYIELSIDDIVPNPDQPRKKIHPAELEELSKTLHSVGLIEPIVVRKKGEKYQLISGERRWRASRLAGFKKIPAVIKQVNDMQALEMGIIENIQREELTPIEEAKAYEQWMNLTGLKPSNLADKIGKDRTTIANLIRLLKLPEEVLSLIEEKKMSAGQARPLLGLGDRKTLVRLASKISQENWPARKVEDEVSKLTETTRAKSESRRDANIASLENKLRTSLSAKVAISHRKNGSGKISISYGNLDDMDRILEKLGIKHR